MKQTYLLLASERRVLNVVVDDGPDAIRRAIGYQTIEHGTTFQTEDQLIIGGDELGGAPRIGSGQRACRLPFTGTRCWWVLIP